MAGTTDIVDMDMADIMVADIHRDIIPKTKPSWSKQTSIQSVAANCFGPEQLQH
jgi:hypothetical protein